MVDGSGYELVRTIGSATLSLELVLSTRGAMGLVDFRGVKPFGRLTDFLKRVIYREKNPIGSNLFDCG
jgi:hypothetical protein